jgi:hypothetical protein
LSLSFKLKKALFALVTYPKRTQVAAEKNAMRGTFANFRTFQRVPLDKPCEPRHKAAQ